MDINIIDKDTRSRDRFSIRKSIFTWIICALFGWIIALSSAVSFFSSDKTPMIVQNEPSAEDAMKMQQILPSSGKTDKEAFLKGEDVPPKF